MLLRLDRILSETGLYTRREAKMLVQCGRVTADGQIVSRPDEKLDPETNVICVDGKPVVYQKYVYLMMNKPAGFVSAREDARDRAVTELLKAPYSGRGLFPAGRLDKDSEGLLLLTDDGAFCHNVISPKKHVEKTYYVETEGALTEADVQAFKKGITLKDGTACLPGKLEILESGEKSSAHVVITEGKYHQVKRMLASLGKPVVILKRLSIGGLPLDNALKPGEYRELSLAELDKIFK